MEKKIQKQAIELLLKKQLLMVARDAHQSVFPAGSSPAILKRSTALSLTLNAEVLTGSKT